MQQHKYRLVRTDRLECIGTCSCRLKLYIYLILNPYLVDLPLPHKQILAATYDFHKALNSSLPLKHPGQGLLRRETLTDRPLGRVREWAAVC